MRVFIDLDHVICDSAWRDGMMGTSSWDEYHEASKDDPPVREIVALVNAMSRAGHDVMGFTVRPEKFRLLTNRWMLEHDVMLSDILMRQDEDFRPAHQIKMEITDGHLRPDLVIDDREDVCRAFRERGITVMQVTVARR